MAIDFNSIRESSKGDLILLAKILDPELNQVPASTYSVEKGYTVRGYCNADIIYSVTAWNGNDFYESPTFTIVVRDVITKPPLEVATALIQKYRGNILLVNRWEPQQPVEEIKAAFRKVNNKLMVLWWREICKL
jgi:hypothetical protein